MTTSEITKAINDFICDNFLFGDRAKLPVEADSLIETGVVDSTGILELIEFLEEKFSISVAESETVPDNLDGVGRLVRYVSSKISA